jgi:hypothetical protein
MRSSEVIRVRGEEDVASDADFRGICSVLRNEEYL